MMIDGVPVLDAVVHPYNLAAANQAAPAAEVISEIIYESVKATVKPGYLPSRDDYLVDWSMEEVADVLFLESDTDLAVNHVLPIYAYADGLCSFDKAVESRERWPGRFDTYCGVDPMLGPVAMEEMERQIEALRPLGLKLYPNSWVGKAVNGWKMDDPEVAFPFFERALELGIKVVAIHKAVPLGPVPLEHYRVDDVDRAAIAFPALNFEVIHGGMAFVEESAWQLARFPNVYVNLEITTSLIGRRPASFERALATLLSVGGEGAVERVLWGTGAIAFHPQPLLETFVRDFQFGEQLIEEGVPELTLERKRMILAENYARMVGMDLAGRLAAIEDDEFSRRRGDTLAAPFSTTHVASLVG